MLWYEVPDDSSIQDQVDPSDVFGVWVRTYAVNGEDEHWYWVRTFAVLTTWAEWDNFITAAMDQHNMAWA